MEKKKQIDCFLPYSTAAITQSLAAQLHESGVVKSIYTLATDVPPTEALPQYTHHLQLAACFPLLLCALFQQQQQPIMPCFI